MIKKLEELKLKIMLYLSLFSKINLPWDLNDIIRRGNAYYKKEFDSIPVKYRAVVLPRCLIHKKCPAKFSKEDGILCINCGLCRCGEIKELCKKKGYQFYITTTYEATKKLAQRKKLKAAIGAICKHDLKKGVKKEKIGLKGMNLDETKVIPQGILLPKYDCNDNDLNWKELKAMINAN